ncbi:MAG: hypothetical protein LBK70_02000 [Clostridiales bacterium]|jgi:plasmid maintenance system killer protein|nr:hypothetical protein [Clostridiales bacterium]
MIITYANKKIEKLCNSGDLQRVIGDANSNSKFAQLLFELDSFDTLKEFFANPLLQQRYKAHQLHSNRKGQYAFKINYKWRLVIVVDGDHLSATEIKIKEIVDYHE